MTPELLLAAYTQGIFPMADTMHHHAVNWICPERRGQLSILNMHIPRSLKKAVKHMRINGAPYDIRINTDFRATISACAQETPDRPETWINTQIIEAFCTLHTEGHAHSIECWQNGEMVGGLYGMTIGGAFFGESMFSRQTDASKVCLVHLAARLWANKFTLLDTQFTNNHLKQFGVYEIPHAEYMTQLHTALRVPTTPFDQNPFHNEIALIHEYLKR